MSTSATKTSTSATEIADVKKRVELMQSTMESAEKALTKTKERVGALKRAHTAREDRLDRLILCSKMSFSPAPPSRDRSEDFSIRLILSFLSPHELHETAGVCRNFGITASHVLAKTYGKEGQLALFEERWRSRIAAVNSKMSSLDTKTTTLSRVLGIGVALMALPLLEYLPTPTLDPGAPPGDFPGGGFAPPAWDGIIDYDPL